LNCDKTMQEEAVVAQSKHDLAGPDVFKGAAGNLYHIARPQSGQHALPVNAQTHPRARTIAAAQNVCDESRAFCTPLGTPRKRRIFRHQEAFRTC
jgi:hypothetical protein